MPVCQFSTKMKNWQKVSISAAIILFCAAIIIASLLYNPELPKSDQELRFHLASNRKFLGFENKSTQFSEFFFIHGSDPQFGLFEAFENPNITIAKNWTQDQYLLRKAVQQWNEMKPKFVVITGDLVHDSPEKPNSQRTKQLADLKMELEKLDQTIPLVLLPGNHDIENEPTEKALNNYKSEFGDDYFSFWVNSVMFIVLNSQLYKEHHLLEKEYEMQNKWLTEQLNDALKNKYTHVIVFQHIPWFLQDINESDNGSNNYVRLMFSIKFC